MSEVERAPDRARGDAQPRSDLDAEGLDALADGACHLIGDVDVPTSRIAGVRLHRHSVAAHLLPCELSRAASVGGIHDALSESSA